MNCTLHLATGRREECPGPGCAFWEHGGAVVGAGCVFDRVRLEFDARPDVARWMLDIRRGLETAHTAEQTRLLRGGLNAVLPPGLHE
jgi:hypothetical protein